MTNIKIYIYMHMKTNSFLHSNQDGELLYPSTATVGAVDCFVTIGLIKIA